MVSGAQLKFPFKFQFQFSVNIVCGYGQKPIDVDWCRFESGRLIGYIGFLVSGL